MEERLRLALGQLEPFEVELADFDTFEHSRSNVMFCQPVTAPKRRALNELYDALVTVFPACASDRPFHPHLTVGQFAKVLLLSAELTPPHWLTFFHSISAIRRKVSS